jgi:heat shock protein HtpX
LLLGLLTTAVIGVGALLGPTWRLLALVLAIGLNIGGYYFSDHLVLRMHGAVEMERSRYPRIHAMTAELARNAGIPTPKLYLIPAMYPNAFATGRNPEHGVVAITEGLSQMLTERELRGVIAHEIAHIRNRDVLIATVAAMAASAITYVVNFFQLSAIFGGSEEEEEGPSPMAMLAMGLVAPIAGMLLHMAISRSREYLADASAAEYCGDPLALAGALQKLSSGSAHCVEEPHPASASLFIVNPLHGGIANWFSTHPPAEERISRLMAMAERGQNASGALAEVSKPTRSRLSSDRWGWPQSV